MNPQQLENILASQAVAPRVTLAAVEANIACETYFTAREGAYGAAMLSDIDDPVYAQASVRIPVALGLLTFCVLTLKNGFTVTGESACASAANFDAEFDKRLAREAAVRKIWPLMGYELRTAISTEAVDCEAEELTRTVSHDEAVPA